MDPETLDLKPNSCKLPCGHWGIELTTLGRAGSILNPYAISSVPYSDGKSLGLVASIVRPPRCPRLCLCYLGSAQLSSAKRNRSHSSLRAPHSFRHIASLLAWQLVAPLSFSVLLRYPPGQAPTEPAQRAPHHSHPAKLRSSHPPAAAAFILSPNSVHGVKQNSEADLLV